MLISAVFSPYGFYTNIHSIRASVDERLRVAANGVLEILPYRYHMRLLEGDISDTEYKELQEKLVDYKRRVGITYLYTVVQNKDGKFYYSLSHDTPPLTPCSETFTELNEVFTTRKITVTQGPDYEYGIVSRTLLLPVEVEDGRMYAIGADLNVDVFRPMIIESLFDFLIIMISGLLLVLAGTAFLSKRISLPIRRLSGFTKKLADSGFSPDLRLADELSEDEISTREVATLANNIELMREYLDDYLKQIKEETAERERIHTELKLAGRLQMSFLPGTEFKYEDLEISAFMRTARESGGDMYDFLVLPSGKLCFAIGDVAGKGITAALFMAHAVSLIRSAASIFTDLNSAVQFINRELCKNNDTCTFLTFFIATFDPQSREVLFINCGHNHPFVKQPNGRAQMLDMKPNSVLGIFDDAEFEIESFTLEKGATLACYTDGVTEAMSSNGGFYGEERLQTLIETNAFFPKEISDAIVKDVDAFSQNCEQADDITLLIVG